MTALPVNELFETIQGEASFTGCPSVFIRLQGCAVGCPWCDTKHTWRTAAADEVLPELVLAKQGDSPAYAWMTAEQIVRAATGFRARHAVITGGEPLMQDLRELTGALLAARFTVQVESSGTEQPRVGAGVWLTVSPKLGMPGGRRVRADAVARANEIKFPVGKPRDVVALRDFLRDFRASEKVVWLQPLSCSEKATAICIEAAAVHGWRVSLQTHKFAGIR